MTRSHNLVRKTKAEIAQKLAEAESKRIKIHNLRNAIVERETVNDDIRGFVSRLMNRLNSLPQEISAEVPKSSRSHVKDMTQAAIAVTVKELLASVVCGQSIEVLTDDS